MHHDTAHDRCDARSEIEALVYRYADLVDAGDFDGVATLLGGAVVRGGSGRVIATDHDGLMRMFGRVRRYDDGTTRTRHVTTNLVIEFDGDGAASARSTFLVLQAIPGLLPLQPVIVGRYHDRFERRDGRWTFTSRQIISDLVGDTTHHVDGAPPSR